MQVTRRNLNFARIIERNMNDMPYVLGAIVFFALAYRFYFSFVAATGCY